MTTSSSHIRGFWFKFLTFLVLVTAGWYLHTLYVIARIFANGLVGDNYGFLDVLPRATNLAILTRCLDYVVNNFAKFWIKFFIVVVLVPLGIIKLAEERRFFLMGFIAVYCFFDLKYGTTLILKVGIRGLVLLLIILAILLVILANVLVVYTIVKKNNKIADILHGGIAVAKNIACWQMLRVIRETSKLTKFLNFFNKTRSANDK